MNAFAYLALLAWAPISVAAFSLLRPSLAAAAVLIGGVLFLPEGVGFDLPGLPPIAKPEVASLCALAGALLRAPRRVLDARPGLGPEILLLFAAAAMAGTVATNRDALQFGPTRIAGLGYYEVASVLVRDVLAYGVPFLLGRALYRSSRDLRDLLLVIAAAGLFYSLFALVELRLSPQFHRWIYGDHQAKFYGVIRAGGYRPMVFMPHGLALALFLLVAALAANALARARLALLGLPPHLPPALLAGMVVLSKGISALVYGLVLLPLQTFLSSRAQVRFAFVLGLLVLAYPVSRMTQVFPTVALVEYFRGIDAERAHSLNFRFEQEEQLLARGRERLWFGWGGFGRGRIYNKRGNDDTIADGFWIIILSDRGVVGLTLLFGLLLAPLPVAARSIGRVPLRRDRVLLAGLTLILAVHAVDLLPNGMFTCLPLFYAGSLFRTLRTLRQEKPARARAPSPAAIPRGVRAPSLR